MGVQGPEVKGRPFEVLPDQIGVVDPAGLARAPYGGLDLAGLDLGEDVPGAELVDIDDDLAAGFGLEFCVIKILGHSFHPSGLGVVGPHGDFEEGLPGLVSDVGVQVTNEPWFYQWSTRGGA